MNEFVFARDLARQVGDLLLNYYHTPGIHTNLKADKSVVTEADLAADQLIIQNIRENFPNDLLLTEELQPTSPAERAMQDNAGWVVDPLDGTTNFSLGLHIWGTLLTRLENGYPHLTVMYFPVLDEMYHAIRDQGAWRNGARLHVRAPDPGRPLPFFACCSRTFRRYQVNVPYKPRILGSSAYTFNAVASGMAVIGFESTPKIWDIAGSWLMVHEAGGVIETLVGDSPFPLQPDLNYASISYPTLAAANQLLANEARRQIIPRESTLEP
jgi:myo-inositol-1(or 4)-monophosphatase